MFHLCFKIGMILMCVSRLSVLIAHKPCILSSLHCVLVYFFIFLFMSCLLPFVCVCTSCTIFSERELTFTFTFAICRRPSVCLSVVCLSSVVCNVRAPYSGY